MIFRPFIDPISPIDFYAGDDREFSLLLPVYRSLSDDRRGNFYSSSRVKDNNGVNLIKVRSERLDGFAPLAVCSYRALHNVYVIGEERPFIMIEFEHSRETRGLTQVVSLFLCHEVQTVQLRKTITDNVILFTTAENAAQKIVEFVSGKTVEYIENVDGHSVGLVYMSWGEKAYNAVERSVASLRRLGYSYPVTIVGDMQKKSDKYNLINVNDVDPFDRTQRKNFKFRAGRVKPLLYNLSPYHYTLYLDADTIFIQPIHQAFTLLKDYDLLVTEEKLSLKDLYNKKLAGWEINIIERDVTIVELDGDDQQRFINSGVLFFKKSRKAKNVFSDWSTEWMRFQEWDEQLALMRAIHKNKAKVLRLPVEWNSPHPDDSSIIFHNYGRGSIRENPS